MTRILLLFLVLLPAWSQAQTECDNPDINCDGYVDVIDLLEILNYFGETEVGPWLDGDDCFSPDVNCSGTVNAYDLLGFLVFLGEEDLDGDGIWDSEDDCVCSIQGCTDSMALNYNLEATEDDGSCLYGESEWNQLGDDLDGEAEGDWSGYSVSISADGSIVAIGAHRNGDGDGDIIDFFGHVRLYEWNGVAWNQLGEDIDGEEGDAFGLSVSLSADGSTVAIGAPGNSANGSITGRVKIYNWNGSAWSQLGENIDGDASTEQVGWSVSLSGDGSVVAIGAPGNDEDANGSGRVGLYEWDGSVWSQLGGNIYGETAFDASGLEVSLSADGSTVAIGAPGNDANGSISNNSGHVRLFDWNGGAWYQLGEDIDGESSGDLSGSSISLSADGLTVAIGASENDGNTGGSGSGNYTGHTRIYQWNANAWILLGEEINSEASGDQSGAHVSLSADGSIVAIGATANSGENGGTSGHVRLYEWSGSSWDQLGDDIDGEAGGDQSGIVSLSADGTKVAIGSFYNDGNGPNSGHVRVYSLE